MYEQIIAYVPAVASLLATVIAMLSFVKKIKVIVSDKDKQNEVLRKALVKAEEANNELAVKASQRIETVENSLKEQIECNKAIVKENKELNETLKEVKTYINDVNTVKTQLTVLLREKRGE